MYEDLQMTWKKNRDIPIQVKIRINKHTNEIEMVQINGCQVTGGFDIPNKDFLKDD